ncbi:hypothetical protein DB35_24820 [Streptomyces abyssalis]|uniref:DUF742 domain-containing protein n=1 Tax=Streptomyces abyssalis TaxID=933944 RepID=A0A1E7JNC7_9ACTN|nr:DUF742 domain-containing protein [Streptomyces abyssalis]OEU86835.1 hypothetical protein DB35_24820 [Streptomyces abyssalis]OEU89781.1 hypothetical protein AN215_08745 [Streptomyces abyssalis]OEV05063.1 hypothetical protein AN219_36680 [Streptomyces nanshensis]
MTGPRGPRRGPVRPYVLTGGRARPRQRLAVETLLETVDPEGTDLPVTASRQERMLWRMCRHRLSVAESAAHLGLSVSVVTILACDLIDAGYLVTRSQVPKAQLPDVHILQEVLDGLRRQLSA